MISGKPIIKFIYNILLEKFIHLFGIPFISAQVFILIQRVPLPFYYLDSTIMRLAAKGSTAQDLQGTAILPVPERTSDQIPFILIIE